MSIKTEPTIKTLKLAELKPDPENPREIDSPAFEGLKHSLERFGVISPIVVNQRNMMIVSGHQRHKALTDLGQDECICILVDLSPEDHRALLVAANSEKISGKFSVDLSGVIDKLRKTLNTDDHLGLRYEELRKKIANKKSASNAGEKKPLTNICPTCSGTGKVKNSESA